MIDKIMRNVENQAEYIDLLSVLRRDVKLDSAAIQRLTELYCKYGDGVEDGEDANIWIAIDMLPGRTRCSKEDFDGIGLSEQSLDALFTAQEILVQNDGVNDLGAQKILAQVNDSAVCLKIRVVLARIALDGMAAAWNFSELLTPVNELAAFICNHSDDMEQCVEFVREMRYKCRRETV